MPFRSSLPALLVLVLFGLGGIGVPVLHQAVHAAEQAAHVEAAHEAADGHAHGEGVAITGALVGIPALDEACALCQVHLASVEAASEWIAAAPETEPEPSAVLARGPSEASAHQPARGPPARG